MSSWFSGKYRPDARTVMGRAIILKHIVVKALVTPDADIVAGWDDELRKQISDKLLATHVEKLRYAGLWPVMSQGERDFIQTGVGQIPERQRIDASWLAESLVCLFWALGYVPKLPKYDEQTSPDSIKALPPFEDSKLALTNAKLIPAEVIDGQRSWAELWNWRCRTRQLLDSGQVPPVLGNGMRMADVIQITASKAASGGAFAAPIGGDFPAFGKPFRDLSETEFAIASSIAQERHRAFNWLCGYAPGNRWEETPTGT